MKNKTRYSKNFWAGNTAELFERMAFYCMFIVLTLYLSTILGFSDVKAGMISGLFSGTLYLLPTFCGAIADKIGYRKALIIAFSCLSIGYFLLSFFPNVIEWMGLADYSQTTTYLGLQDSSIRWGIIPSLFFVALGGAFVKSVVGASVSIETTGSNRTKGFSIFYMMINIGSFTGKLCVEPIRMAFGDQGLIFVNYFSTIVAILALLVIIFAYKPKQVIKEGHKFRDIILSFANLFKQGRLIALILIISGFWVVYFQMYATMPKYVIRLIGESATPAWYSLMNPIIVVIFVNIVTELMKKVKAVTSMNWGLLVVVFSTLIMSLGTLFGDDKIFGMHPVALMMIIGIAFQAFAEILISPRCLEYFSSYAPKGDDGLYIGFSQIHSFISNVVGFGISGFLLEKYCPDPANFATRSEWLAASEHANYIWLIFMAIGLFTTITLKVFTIITDRIDKKNIIKKI